MLSIKNIWILFNGKIVFTTLYITESILIFIWFVFCYFFLRATSATHKGCFSKTHYEVFCRQVILKPTLFVINFIECDGSLFLLSDGSVFQMVYLCFDILSAWNRKYVLFKFSSTISWFARVINIIRNKLRNFYVLSHITK